MAAQIALQTATHPATIDDLAAPASHLFEVPAKQPWSIADPEPLLKPHPIVRVSSPVSPSDTTPTRGDVTTASSDAAPCNSIQVTDTPIIAVLGVGYVGAHLVAAFAPHFSVLGYDVSAARVRQLQASAPPTVRYTHSPADLARATHFLVSVPTLLTGPPAAPAVDASCLQAALATLATHARRGATVVIESSIAVGMTRALLGPLARAHGWFAGMSPERVDPGRTSPAMPSIPKIVSGLESHAPGSLAAISRVYARAFAHLVPVSCPEVAELTKLYENCQRMVCIAYANEMADACAALEQRERAARHEQKEADDCLPPPAISPYEVCAAAATKPFGYAPFAPGMGVGGHCIPVNPHYLAAASCRFPLLELATAQMARRPAELAARALQRVRATSATTAAAAPAILVVGIGFKRGQAGLSNSPGLAVARALVQQQVAAGGAAVRVEWADALVAQDAVPEIPRLADAEWTRARLDAFGLIMVAFRQEGMDFGELEGLQHARVEMWCA